MEDKTSELFRTYPSYRGDTGENAKKAIGKYSGNHWEPGTTIEDAEKIRKEVDRWDEVKGLGEKIADVVNSRNPDEVAQALFSGIASQHRTLQAQAVFSLIKFLDLYRESSYDPRNRAAVIAAERISQVVGEEHIYIPLI